MGLIEKVKGMLSSAEKEDEEPKCRWCGKEGDLPFSKKIKSEKEWKEVFFCSEECKKQFRIAYNQKQKSRGCSRCLLSKIH